MKNHFHKSAGGRTFQYARENRKKQTEAEQLLWKNLRGRKLSGFKFRRQHPIAGFIADFYCHECLLVVEVDGGYHTQIEQKDYDSGRTSELREFGVKVIRFTNNEVVNNIGEVLNEMKKHLYS